MRYYFVTCTDFMQFYSVSVLYSVHYLKNDFGFSKVKRLQLTGEVLQIYKMLTSIFMCKKSIKIS